MWTRGMEDGKLKDSRCRETRIHHVDIQRDLCTNVIVR